MHKDTIDIPCEVRYMLSQCLQTKYNYFMGTTSREVPFKLRYKSTFHEIRARLVETKEAHLFQENSQKPTSMRILIGIQGFDDQKLKKVYSCN